MSREPTLDCEYTYSSTSFSKEHVWTCVGGRGALHLHISDRGDGRPETERYSAGLELHSRTPFPGCDHDAPNHADCWLLKQPCWHDGTSLWARTHWLPIWLLDPAGHDRMFDRLRADYRRRFMGEPDVS